MSEKIEPILKEFTKNGIIGKVIIGGISIFIIFGGIFLVMMGAQNNAMLSVYEAQATITAKQGDNLNSIANVLAIWGAKQEEVDNVKKKVYAQYNRANDAYRIMISTLGRILQENKVPFPQDLNTTIGTFAKAFNSIPGELMYPWKE